MKKMTHPYLLVALLIPTIPLVAAENKKFSEEKLQEEEIQETKNVKLEDNLDRTVSEEDLEAAGITREELKKFSDLFLGKSNNSNRKKLKKLFNTFFQDSTNKETREELNKKINSSALKNTSKAFAAILKKEKNSADKFVVNLLDLAIETGNIKLLYCCVASRVDESVYTSMTFEKKAVIISLLKGIPNFYFTDIIVKILKVKDNNLYDILLLNKVPAVAFWSNPIYQHDATMKVLKDQLSGNQVNEDDLYANEFVCPGTDDYITYKSIVNALKSDKNELKNAAIELLKKLNDKQVEKLANCIPSNKSNSSSTQKIRSFLPEKELIVFNKILEQKNPVKETIKEIVPSKKIEIPKKNSSESWFSWVPSFAGYFSSEIENTSTTTTTNTNKNQKQISPTVEKKPGFLDRIYSYVGWKKELDNKKSSQRLNSNEIKIELKK